SPRAEVVDQPRRVLGLETLVPGIVDHHHRRPIAGAETLDFDERERAGLVGLPGVQADLLRDRFGDALGAVQRARQGAADLHHILADRASVEHRVEGHDVLDVGAGDAEQLGAVADRIGRDIALLLLRQIERRQDRRAAAIGGIALDDLVEPRPVLRRVDKRGPFLFELALGSMEAGVVGHLRMKAHRSTSPMTTSIDPITAMTSAINPPTIMRSSAWHASSDGARDFTRHGRLVPSDTIEKPCSPRGPSTGTYASPAGTEKPWE